MKRHVKEITDSLQTNTTLQSLTLCVFRKSASISIQQQSYNDDDDNYNDYDDYDDDDDDKLVIEGKLLFNILNNDVGKVTSKSDNRVVNVKVLYNDDDCKCSPETINLSDMNIDDNRVCLISFGLYNNTTVQKLDLSCNKIIDTGANAISDSLKHNNTLKELNLSQNKISIRGMIKLSECIAHTVPLEYVDLNGNKSSPWGVYCTIIRHCCVNSLTLCGDEGMKEYVQQITDILQTNTVLQSLTLCKIGRIGVQSVKNILPNITVLNQLNLSWESNAKGKAIISRKYGNRGVVDINILYDGEHKHSFNNIALHNKNIDDDAVCLISFGLCNNTTVERLDLSCNKITDTGVNSISDSLNHNNTLKELNLSQNKLSSGLYNNTTLEKIDLSCNKITNDGAIIIIDSLKHNNTLLELNLSQNEIATFGLYNNTTVQKLDLSCNKIADDGAIAISDSLKNNNTLKELNLSQNEIDIKGMNKLSECITHTITLEYVDLSGNKSSPWGVYCAIIRHCCVNSLTLCGDEGMKEYVKETANSLQINTILQSLTLCNIEDAGLLVIPYLINNTALKELNASWRSKGTRIVCGKLILSTLDNKKVVLNACPLTSFTENINEIVTCLIASVSFKMAIQKLDLSGNNITSAGAIIIGDCLRKNHTLKELNLSQNQITLKGMRCLSKCITHSIPLEYVDLSGNKSSPWSVYCAIIRHCCVNSLTLCGDEGMKEYVKEITDSLQTNTILQSLTLYKIGRIGVQSIKDVLSNNITLKELNMSWMSEGRNIIINRKLTYSTSDNTRLDSNSNNNRVVDINILYDGDCECSCRTISLSNQGIDDDAVCLITFALYNNTTLQELDLSCNNITDDGAVAISDCFRNNCSLQTLILSRNYISYKGAKSIAEIIHVNKIIQKLDVSHNNIIDDGAIAISECLKTNNTLQELILSNNHITSKGMEKITEALKVNKSLLYIDISHNDIDDDGLKYIIDILKHNDKIDLNFE